MIITLQVFELNKQQLGDYDEDEDEDIEVNLEECDLVEYTFYNVDNIKRLNGGKYCLLSSGGNLYTVNELYITVKGLIAEQKRILFN